MTTGTAFAKVQARLSSLIRCSSFGGAMHGYRKARQRGCRRPERVCHKVSGWPIASFCWRSGSRSLWGHSGLLGEPPAVTATTDFLTTNILAFRRRTYPAFRARPGGPGRPSSDGRHPKAVPASAPRHGASPRRWGVRSWHQTEARCLLCGVKQTSWLRRRRSEFDPKRTLSAYPTLSTRAA